MDQDQVQRVGLLPANQVKLVKTNRGLTKAFISRTIIQSRAWYLSYSCSNWEASAFGLQDKCVSSSLFLIPRGCGSPESLRSVWRASSSPV
ncbi:hypothetical protein HZ326_3790 [Fusarium oxysporum f. sp. albedinis]|nr:hypothetical protein HZ326_3790 [Fusarium oxysporum f. sp. albedinis]